MTATRVGCIKGPVWTEQEKDLLKREWRPSDRVGSVIRISKILGRPENGVKFQALKLGLCGNPARGSCKVCGGRLGWSAETYCSRRCKALDQWEQWRREKKTVRIWNRKMVLLSKPPVGLRVTRSELLNLYMSYGYTLQQIADKIECSYGALLALIDYFKFPRRGYVKRYIKIKREDKDKIIFTIQVPSHYGADFQLELQNLVKSLRFPASMHVYDVEKVKLSQVGKSGKQ